jgi:hypothetical protein
MEILVAIDELDDLVAQSPHIPLTDQVRIDEQALRNAAGRIRPTAIELLGPFPARTGATADVIGAIDELEQLVAAAGRVPLTGQLRVDPHRMFDVLDRLRATFPAAIAETRGVALTETAQSPAQEAFEALEDLVLQSNRAFLSDSLRIDEQALHIALSELRATVGPTATDALAAITELEDLVRAKKRVPSEPLFGLVDRLRIAVASGS